MVDITSRSSYHIISYQNGTYTSPTAYKRKQAVANLTTCVDVKAKKSYLSETVQVLLLLLQVPLTLLNELLY